MTGYTPLQGVPYLICRLSPRFGRVDLAASRGEIVFYEACNVKQKKGVYVHERGLIDKL
jgi:hypothetical protein